jgi:hypothetical protein
MLHLIGEVLVSGGVAWIVVRLNEAYENRRASEQIGEYEEVKHRV